MNSMEIEAFPADAVILATGGPGVIFGKCTASTICNGSAVSDVYQEGAYLGNVEFIQIHPTAIPGEDKNRLMSEAARGEGGRVWTYKDGKLGTSSKKNIQLMVTSFLVISQLVKFIKFAYTWVLVSMAKIVYTSIFPTLMQIT